MSTEKPPQVRKAGQNEEVLFILWGIGSSANTLNFLCNIK
jgi:hypothetical protein